jgi:hypothetical protein
MVFILPDGAITTQKSEECPTALCGTGGELVCS